jgi:hypothetical protein
MKKMAACKNTTLRFFIFTFYGLFLSALLSACGGNDESESSTSEQAERPVIVAQVSVDDSNNTFLASWNDVDASTYRVLFWDVNGNLHETTTEALSASIAFPVNVSEGTVVIEYFDNLGNSGFSDPLQVEAL